MLILSRKPSERIVIDNEIEITVVRVRGKSVQLGIKAPREVPLLRGELIDNESVDLPILPYQSTVLTC